MTEGSQEKLDEVADASAGRISKVYATALLDVAEKRGEAETVLEELRSLVRDVFAQEPRLEILLSGAAVGREAREAILRKTFEGRSSSTFLNFLQVLNKHDRLGLLRPIFTATSLLYDERHQRLRVYVSSAVPLTDEVRLRLENGMRSRFNLEPVLMPEVDPKLLGGLKVRIGDRQFDGSIRNRLNLLRDQILASGSHAIQSRRDRFSSGE